MVVRRLITVLVAAAAVSFAVLGYLYFNRPDAITIGGPIHLQNQDGAAFDSASLAGKPYVVFFGFTHCPDVCPTTLFEMSQVEPMLGQAAQRQLQIIAVSVDPKRDTREAVAEFVAAHAMTGKMKYLVGDAHELARVWEAWNVGSERDSVNPEFVAHSALIYGVSASGRLTTIYPSNFKPEQIVADLPKLLRD